MASHPAKQKVAGGGSGWGEVRGGGSEQKEEGLVGSGVVIAGGRRCKGDKW